MLILTFELSVASIFSAACSFAIGSRPFLQLTFSPRRRARVFPMSEGVSDTEIPAALNASIFYAAVPFPPEMTAPAWPIRFPLGAVWPAMNPTTGLVTCAFT